jgi:hypothetical protein
MPTHSGNNYYGTWADYEPPNGLRSLSLYFNLMTIGHCEVSEAEGIV